MFLTHPTRGFFTLLVNFLLGDGQENPLVIGTIHDWGPHTSRGRSADTRCAFLCTIHEAIIPLSRGEIFQSLSNYQI